MAENAAYWHQRFVQAESEKASVERELAVERDKVRNTERKTFMLIVEQHMEDAETELQCPICNEVFIEATTTNCGHTYCRFCINKWMKHGRKNCPTCRTKITQTLAVKTLDNYTDKIYEKFESDTRQAARTSLKEERLKLRAKVEREAVARREQKLQRFNNLPEIEISREIVRRLIAKREAEKAAERETERTAANVLMRLRQEN